MIEKLRIDGGYPACDILQLQKTFHPHLITGTRREERRTENGKNLPASEVVQHRYDVPDRHTERSDIFRSVASLKTEPRREMPAERINRERNNIILHNKIVILQLLVSNIKNCDRHVM